MILTDNDVLRSRGAVEVGAIGVLAGEASDGAADSGVFCCDACNNKLLHGLINDWLEFAIQLMWHLQQLSSFLIAQSLIGLFTGACSILFTSVVA